MIIWYMIWNDNPGFNEESIYIYIFPYHKNIAKNVLVGKIEFKWAWNANTLPYQIIVKTQSNGFTVYIFN